MQSIKKNPTEQKITTYDHLDKIGEIPIYYGFFPHKSPEIKKIDLDLAKTLLEGDFIDDDNGTDIRLPLHVEEKVALLRMYSENEMNNLPQPVMFYFKEPFKSALKKGDSAFHRYCDLEIMGGSKSIAEAILIQTTRAILKEEGYEKICVDINSIGDRDSINRFTRDLGNYYRKHVNDMHAECRQLLKKDPLDLLSCQNDKCRKINETAPHSMDFLSESSRTHFQEVLEYLEALSIPYKINNNLIGNKKYCTETIFSINNVDENSRRKQKILAIGVRYDGLSKKVGYKKEIHGVGISLLIKNNKSHLRKEIKKIKRPFASFVQLGFESKLLSLEIIEKLRKEKIPLFLSLARDRLGAQVSAVEKFHIPYSLIMGKKEAVEKTIIVRNNETHAQEIITIDDLPKYMRKLEK
ncbi:MAG: His/Gly/Thr/Pro-type tRNA ligase C-terminal domain-containing protein [Candidatus Taylorbacteria bacterium]|nr:His/Gly/Thr/Pro-type tRNA ligase C-terminal domain-containing protein [Candidatus Taylorbacteria bacterium]